jgi:hypothetical protein
LVWTAPLLASRVLVVLSAFFLAAVAAACRIKVATALSGLLALLTALAWLVALLAALLTTLLAALLTTLLTAR